MHYQVAQRAYTGGTNLTSGSLTQDCDPVYPAIKGNVRPFRDKRSFVNQLLTDLAPAVVEKLHPFLKTIYLQREDYVYQQEDRIDYLYFPETVVFTEYQMLNDGRTIEIALTGSESAIGLTSVFSVSRSANWTQVCTSGSAVRIDSEIFRSAVEQDSSAKALLNCQLNSYIRQISHKVICNTHHSVEKRLCTWLMMLQDRCGSSTIKVTQEQLARILGVYRPSITCIAQCLRERGIIDYTRGKIIICSRTALSEAACSCYSEFAIDRSPRPLPNTLIRRSALA